MLNSQQVVSRILAIHPAIKTVTLYAIQPGEAVTGGVPWKIIRKNADKETLLVAGIQADTDHRLFQLLQQSQTVVPAQKYRIVDWSNVAWMIHSIDFSMGDMVFDCLCTRALT